MNKIILISVAFLVVGCGVVGRAPQRSEPRRPAESERVGQGRLERQGMPRREYRMLEGDAGAERYMAFPMSFRGLETEHVKAQGVVNPIPAGGLEVNLERLKADFRYPVDGRLISDYGMRSGRQHTGIDIKAMRGDTVRAAFPGVVRMSKMYSSYGNIVVIRHYAGFETVYSHGSKNLVEPNDVVRAGDPIALAGRTGRATTEHLHFEVRVGGTPVDPKLVVDPERMELRSGWLFAREQGGVVSAANSPSGLRVAEGEAADDKAAREEAMNQAITESESASKVAPPPAVEPVYYTIKSGDVLGKIAQRNGTTVAKLCALNGIKSPDRIRAGQRIRIR